MECRKGCAACCIYIHISSPMPGYPRGKPPGERCIHLDGNNLCRIWNSPEYPEVCGNFTPTGEFCGGTNREARERLTALEALTSPEGKTLENEY